MIYIFQLIRLNAKGQLGVGERCISADNQGVKFVFCRLGTVDGPWQYDEVNIIKYIISLLNFYFIMNFIFYKNN